HRRNFHAQRVAFDEFHRQVRSALSFSNLVDGADVRMVQSGDRAGFGENVGAGHRIVDSVDREKLQGNVAVQRQITRTIHDTHATLTQLCGYVIVSDRWTDHKIQPRRGEWITARDEHASLTKHWILLVPTCVAECPLSAHRWWLVQKSSLEARLSRSQIGAPIVLSSAVCFVRATETRRGFACCCGTRRAWRWSPPGRAVFPRLASACTSDAPR